MYFPGLVALGIIFVEAGLQGRPLQDDAPGT
jgi:hypothetical protein